MDCTGVAVAETTFEDEGEGLEVGDVVGGFEAEMAFASSSTSLKSSWATALSEYAHTPTANDARMPPVKALRKRKGARARWRPGDMTCISGIYDAIQFWVAWYVVKRGGLTLLLGL